MFQVPSETTKMSTTPSCTTPVSLRPVSPGMLDQFNLEEESFDFGLVTSPGSKRCPTFKDLHEKIRQLQQENFQLRVRIYLNEQKAGVKTSSSDLAVLYTHLPHIQNGGANGMHLGLPHSTVHSSPSTSSASAFDSVNNELDKIKLEKQQLAETVSSLEQKLRACEENLATNKQQIANLEGKNEELLKKNTEIMNELEIANSSIQPTNTSRNSSRLDKINDEEAERLGCFAFGQNDDVELINAEWEAKLLEKCNETQKLQTALDHTRKKLNHADLKIKGLQSELMSFEVERPIMQAKIREMTASLNDMGKRYVHAKSEADKLKRKLVDQAADDFEKLTISSSSEKLYAVQQVVTMLQSKMKELASFVETLLQLESKKVLILTGLTDENRENLLKSIEQSRMVSDSLDQLLEKDPVIENHNPYISTSFFREQHRDIHHGHHHMTAGSSKSMFSALDRVRLKSDGVQCNLVDSALQSSLESANTYINKLKQDIATVERINIQLNQEKTDLITQVKSLESSVLRISNHVDNSGGVEYSKLKEENRKLTKRLTVTEDALRHLHTQHAKLVGELKTLRSTYQKSSKASGSTNHESTRPSDSNSPDLGIDSGHDGAMNSDDSNGNNYKEENRILRTTNRELALKLKQTRQALDNTLEKLNSTTKEKEQVEKAICRQLHKTHTILRQAKRSVEKFTSSQCQENIVPSP
ncbi:hypothetical protein Ocin01_07884 [Orchesella cincta]|uniref:Centrosomin n=1 Tax=Orchesella cincta TaxID=48709 RepID=A0A1D2N0J1_ORCCI|nr:hypothetical protein Ocin01_07884 [Orchesella cincta]